MTLEDRTRNILDKVRLLDARFGRDADLTNQSTGSNTRIITDQPAIWKAVITRGYLSASLVEGHGAAGKPWDLFQVYAYDQLRITAHIRGDDVRLTRYVPGVWEAIFFLVDLPNIPALLPGGFVGDTYGQAARY